MGSQRGQRFNQTRKLDRLPTSGPAGAASLEEHFQHCLKLKKTIVIGSASIFNAGLFQPLLISISSLFAIRRDSNSDR